MVQVSRTIVGITMGWTIDPPHSDVVKAVVSARGVVEADVAKDALRSASQAGAPGMIDRLGEHVDLHQNLGSGRTTLHEAAARGHTQVCERLIELGGDPSRPDDEGSTAAAMARRHGHTVLADRLESLVTFGRAASAIHRGDAAALAEILRRDPKLVSARLLGETLMHVVVLWPAHRTGAADCIRVLHDAGADVSAPYRDGPFGHEETPLHGAVSANDIDAATALIDLGADVDAPGAVIGNGPPLVNAVAFKKWASAHLLVLRGCKVNLPCAAALGRMDLVRRFVGEDGTVAEGACDLPGGAPGARQNVALNLALHLAVHGEQLKVASWLHSRGAALDWVGPDGRSTTAQAHDVAAGWAKLLNPDVDI